MINTLKYIPTYHLGVEIPETVLKHPARQKAIRVLATIYNRDGILQYIRYFDIAERKAVQVSTKKFCTYLLPWFSKGTLSDFPFKYPVTMLLEDNPVEDITQPISTGKGTTLLVDYKGNYLEIPDVDLDAFVQSHKLTLAKNNCREDDYLRYYRYHNKDIDWRTSLGVRAVMGITEPIIEIGYGNEFINAEETEMSCPRYVPRFFFPSADVLQVWRDTNLDEAECEADYREQLDEYLYDIRYNIMESVEAIKFPEVCDKFGFYFGFDGYQYSDIPFAETKCIILNQYPDKSYEYMVALNEEGSKLKFELPRGLEDITIKVFRENIQVACNTADVAVQIDFGTQLPKKLPRIHLIDLTGPTDVFLDVKKLVTHSQNTGYVLSFVIPLYY